MVPKIRIETGKKNMGLLTLRKINRSKREVSPESKPYTGTQSPTKPQKNIAADPEKRKAMYPHNWS